MLRADSTFKFHSPDLSMGLAANVSKRLAFSPGLKPPSESGARVQGTTRRSSSKIMQIPQLMYREASSAQFFNLAALPDSETVQSGSVQSSMNTFSEVDFKLPELEMQLGQNIQDVLLHEEHKDKYSSIRKEILREASLLRRLDNLAKTPDHLLMGKNPRFDQRGRVTTGASSSPHRRLSSPNAASGLPPLAAVTTGSPNAAATAGASPDSRQRGFYSKSNSKGSPNRVQTATSRLAGNSNAASLHTLPNSTRVNTADAALNPAQVRARRNMLECKTELALIKHIISRKPGELSDKLTALQEQLEMESLYGIDDDLRESTLDHPKLGSVEEKMEDLRSEETERWCAKHGKRTHEKYTNMEKRMLRKWFQAMDNDGSGEVNVEELQDPMLSAGIFKTREQVVRVLANVDKNHTMGIDFEEFLLALSANRLADKSKLRKLQEMSMDPVFDVDTLITAERRKKLMKSILRRSQHRQEEMDKLYKKYDKPKLSKKEREQLMREQEILEDKQARSIFLHLKYLNALDRVLVDKKNQLVQATLEKQQELEEHQEAQQRQKENVQARIARKDSQLLQDLQEKAKEMVDNSSGLPVLPLDALAEIMGVNNSAADKKRREEEAEKRQMFFNPYSIYAPPKRRDSAML